MSTKLPECWANAPQARGVRVEISVEHSMLLPHDEFAFVELKGEVKEQELPPGFRHARSLGSRPFLAAYRDGNAAIGVVASYCTVWQTAVTHSRRPDGRSRNCRHGDQGRGEMRPRIQRIEKSF